MKFLERFLEFWHRSTDERAPSPEPQPFPQRPEPYDRRDHVFLPQGVMEPVLPARVDLRAEFPAAYEQGELGSCSAQTVAALVHRLRRQSRRGRDYTPSRLAIYYWARAEQGWEDADSGAYIRDALKAVHQRGVPSEGYWPYLPARLTRKPSALAMSLGRRNALAGYARVPQRESALKAALAQGRPIICGVTVFASGLNSEAARLDGRVPLPPEDEPALGGHAVVLVGYDDAEGHFVFRNSWGPGWGDQGCGYLPYAYVLDSALAFDFWTTGGLK